uniref:Hypothetical orf2 n=1 Tax=Epidermophyton floccosum TaxID=34391 RepID=Q3ZEH5_EPIFL|nr:hypothetical orf2 [Epidermophyton floccosum]AAW78228.1 hypothetical orf2 [Epidermophyton floccosum]
MILNYIIIVSIGLFVFVLLQSNFIKIIEKYIPLPILLILLVLILLSFSNYDIILLEGNDKNWDKHLVEANVKDNNININNPNISVPSQALANRCCCWCWYECWS